MTFLGKLLTCTGLMLSLFGMHLSAFGVRLQRRRRGGVIMQAGTWTAAREEELPRITSRGPEGMQ